MNIRKRAAVILVALMGSMFAGSAAGGSKPDTPMTRFMNVLSTMKGLDPDAGRMIRESWETCHDCDAEEFLTQGLALVSEPFRAGLDAYDADDAEECVRIMGALRASDNVFVATHAAVYEIKSLVALERLSDAVDRIQRLAADGGVDLENHTYYSAEVAFLRGFCLLGGLQYEAAEAALKGFLADYPDAPQRLSISARQMLAELAGRESGQIGEVVDLMNYARRKLGAGSFDEPVQDKQKRIVDLLDRMIKEAKQKEQSSSSESSSGGGEKNGGQQKGGGMKNQRSQNPAQRSVLPGGASAKGKLRPGRRANPAKTWGSMPPAQRQRVLQALRDSFPSRYRRLVEQYYEELAKKR